MTMRCFRGLGINLLSPPSPSFLACWGEAHRGPMGSRKMWNVAKSHEWKRKKRTRNVVLESRETTPSLQMLPAGLQPHCPWKTHFFLLPSSLLKIKETMLLAPQTLWQPMVQNLHSIQKRGKTQAGCKLFESFMRRGIFPCKIFFLFKVCFKIKRAREKSWVLVKGV